ncbi:hypothetical protein [Qingshengfaniella alkalisoli]|uniref:Ferrochelatase n=1 Tax=Qingshengfaniella alkalisoli TaxID=2599296 RepID=A0A5B8ICV8_9RHOB|nr:hypothetical protein [Qingshengfaniella alkalisoli]QDY71446.1 hypothetical protein FPZ52_17350 [Qingshengfaniella alkalisoli]
MKKLVLAAAFSAVASSAFAGGYVEPMPEPVIEPVVVEEDTGSSTGGWIVPVLLLALVGVAVS